MITLELVKFGLSVGVLPEQKARFFVKISGVAGKKGADSVKVGFIGAGNMGSALMASMKMHATLYAYDISEAACEKANQNFGAIIVKSVDELVRMSEIVFIAIKPQFLEEIYVELKAAWSKEKVLASIVAGKTISHWQEVLGENSQIARIMPNTPAMVQEGMNTVCFSATLKSPEVILQLLSYTGRVMQLKENVMDAAMGVAGCGPAFVYMFIEALADAGVAGGLFRKQAYELAAQTVLGAAKMVLETQEHPAALKDAVCSPAGTTIRGVLALEKNGFRSAVEEAVLATQRKLQ